LLEIKVLGSFGLFAIHYLLFPYWAYGNGMIMVCLFYSIIIPMAYLGIGEWDYGFWDIKGLVRFTIATLGVVYTTCSLNYQQFGLQNYSRNKGKRKGSSHRFRKIIGH